MHKAIWMIRNLAIGAALWAAVGAAIGAELTLTTSNVGFNSPIGIDFQENSSKLILSVNYPTGSPNNLELADPSLGTATVFAPTFKNELNEVKVATVRASPCLATQPI